MQHILSVQDVTKQYTDQPGGVRNVSFEVPEGKITAIIGESGSGKSTLLKCLYGTLKVDAGEVRFKGSRVKGPDEQLVPGHGAMRMVTQDFSLNIYAKVYDNISAMLANTDIAGKERRTREVMDQLHIGHLQNKRITELSGGEQQRVAIARALVSNIDMLLLDEPFSQVDTLLKAQLRDDLRKLVRETGITIVLVSHDPADGISMGEQLLILKDGTILQHGSPQALYNDPAHPHIAKLLGNANIFSAEEATILGLKVSGQTVIVYPEWVLLKNSWNSRNFTLTDIVFKGSYEELHLERKGVHIRAIHTRAGAYQVGDKLSVELKKFVAL